MNKDNKKWELASINRTVDPKSMKQKIDNVTSTLTPDIRSKLINLHTKYGKWFVGSYEENMETFYLEIYKRTKGTPIGMELRTLDEKPNLQRHIMRDYISKTKEYNEDYQTIEILDFNTLKTDIYYLINEGIYKNIDEIITPIDTEKKYNREETYRNYMNCLIEFYLT